MTRPTRLWVDNAGLRIALLRWGEVGSDKPAALLAHGTGFVGDVWTDIADPLAATYTVYALDRRGHGVSDKPDAGGYHFQDYASDICAIVDALDLSNIYGIGHSAGATDLLLAAKLRPGRFARLFVMEPTVMDPDAVRSGNAQLSPNGLESLQRALRRKPVFDHADAVYARYRHADAFADWTESALRNYIRHGFAQLADGRVKLLCEPATEAAILRPIYEAMEQVYTGDARGNPFGWLREIVGPVRIATAETSWPIYKEMAARACRLMPAASHWTFDGVGHCVGQEAPTLLLAALQAFARA